MIAEKIAFVNKNLMINDKKLSGDDLEAFIGLYLRYPENGQGSAFLDFPLFLRIIK